MSKLTRKTTDAPKFYRDLGKEAVESYLRRKARKEPTGHFSRKLGKYTYVFWNVGYDEAGNEFPMKPAIDAMIRRLVHVAMLHGIAEPEESRSLRIRSINKPGTMV